MPTAKLLVRGLRDEADAARLERTLAAEPGVFAAVVSGRDACVEIDYEDDEVPLERLFQLVGEAGFRAELAG